MKKTYKFDFESGDYVLENGIPIELSGIDALKMWIEKTIRTQLGRYKLYRGKSYGTNIEDLVIGHTYKVDFAYSEIKRELEKSLLQHEDIHEMSSFDIDYTKSKMNISFTLKTAYGTDTEVIGFDG